MGRGFDSHFRVIEIVQLVRTIVIAGSNPAQFLELLTSGCRFRLKI